MSRKTQPSPVNGLLPIVKPRGMVSKDVSRRLERVIGRVRMGHVGTLDPMASGVLPILLGSATRLQDALLAHPKTYEFDVTFGFETETLDCDGKIVAESNCEHLTEAQLLDALPAFRGDIEQVPPLFSAVKFRGKALYKYARQNELPVDLELEGLKRQVHINQFELVSFNGRVSRFRVECSKGVYVRVLARDLARAVGTHGTVTDLVRTSASGISQSDCFDLQEVTPEEWQGLVIPVADLKLGLRRWRVFNSGLEKRLLRGQRLTITDRLFQFEDEAPLRGHEEVLLLSSEGQALGLGTARPREGQVVVAMKRGL